MNTQNNKAGMQMRPMRQRLSQSTLFFLNHIDKRTQVVFSELLRVASKHAELRPDRDLLDLISRARAIAAGFDIRVK
jgi:hypothetical protein